MRASLLAETALEALAGLCPGWRVWADGHGWHAQRRGSRYIHRLSSCAPSFCVHAGDPAGMHARLEWQRAAAEHAPSGCSATW
jgi:hypothetical protein